MEKYVCPICKKEFGSIAALKTDICFHEKAEKIKIERDKEKENLEKLNAIEKRISDLYSQLLAAITQFNSLSNNKKKELSLTTTVKKKVKYGKDDTSDVTLFDAFTKLLFP